MQDVLKLSQIRHSLIRFLSPSFKSVIIINFIYCAERGGLERVLDYKNPTRFEFDLSWVGANSAQIELSYLRVVFRFDGALTKQFVIEN